MYNCAFLHLLAVKALGRESSNLVLKRSGYDSLLLEVNFENFKFNIVHDSCIHNYGKQ